MTSDFQISREYVSFADKNLTITYQVYANGARVRLIRHRENGEIAVYEHPNGESCIAEWGMPGFTGYCQVLSQGKSIYMKSLSIFPGHMDTDRPLVDSILESCGTDHHKPEVVYNGKKEFQSEFGEADSYDPDWM